MKKINRATLALCLAITAFAACKKSDNATHTTGTTAITTASSAPTAGMGSVRNWHRHHYYTASGEHFATPVNQDYFLADTSFAVTIAGDSTVSMFGTSYAFSTTDTVKKVRYFGQAYYYYYYGMGDGVAYFYAKDSIAWCSGDLHHTSDYWERKNLCYTH